MSVLPNEELKAYTFQLPDGPVVVRFSPVSEVLYDKFENDRRVNESAARTMLVKSCVRSHDGSQLDELFDRYPAIKHAMAMAILKEAGGFIEMLEGELSPS